MSDRSANRNRIRKISASGVLILSAVILCGCRKSDFSGYIPRIHMPASRVIYVDTSDFRGDAVIDRTAELAAASAAEDADTISLIREEAEQLSTRTAAATEKIDVELLLTSIRTGEEILSAEIGEPVSIERYVLPLAGIESSESEAEYMEQKAEVLEKLAELRTTFPDGSYWNYGTVTDSPCRHHEAGIYSCNYYGGKVSEYFGKESGKQCLGFASLISDRLFGEDAPISEFYDFSELRVGDHVRIEGESYHSFIVIEITEDSVTALECNRDCETCLISWGEEYSREYLEDVGARYTTRYPVR